MLRYDARWLVEYYRDEPAALPGLPYAPLGWDGPYTVVKLEQPFRLTSAIRVQPRLDYDESIFRLADYGAKTLRVQRCAYSDGIKSNYLMDGPGELRAVLRAEYGARLPPLSDTRLANGIGTAVVVFDAALRPYLPRRAPRQSVFPGGYHCTASGETLWSETASDTAATFEEIFTAHICRELEEEVGLTAADLSWIRPVAFCREFLRGGKPQFFFAAQTLLGADEMAVRRRQAIARQIAAGRQEVEDDVLETVTPQTLRQCTIEAVANLQLAMRIIKRG
jgi:hypothetical protein